MTALRSIVRNIVREPRPCSKFSISRPFFTIHTWNVYTLLTACLNLLYCIYLYIYMLLCIYAYVCHRGSCIARICIMQPDAATLGAYVTRYISRSLGRGGKRDEKRFPSFVDSALKGGNETVFTPFPPHSILFERVFYTWPRGYDRSDLESGVDSLLTRPLSKSRPPPIVNRAFAFIASDNGI